jgi:hypothetical protein
VHQFSLLFRCSAKCKWTLRPRPTAGRFVRAHGCAKNQVQRPAKLGRRAAHLPNAAPAPGKRPVSHRQSAARRQTCHRPEDTQSARSSAGIKTPFISTRCVNFAGNKNGAKTASTATFSATSISTRLFLLPAGKIVRERGVEFDRNAHRVSCSAAGRRCRLRQNGWAFPAVSASRPRA